MYCALKCTIQLWNFGGEKGGKKELGGDEWSRCRIEEAVEDVGLTCFFGEWSLKFGKV